FCGVERVVATTTVFPENSKKLKENLEPWEQKVFLPFGVRQVIEKKIQEKDVDISLFDEAIKHVEQVLRNDPYVRFLQSPQYLNLLAKLKN
ncbi:regulator of G protein signaling domain protein, partial [Ancylostoma duodenale]